MSQPELLKRVVAVLDAAGIDYMLSGSLVSSLQGEPRSTHDIDIVVSISPTAAEKLLAAFGPPDFYLDRAAVASAIAQGSMFNLLDVNEGDKVDFWMLTDDPFDQSRFARKYGHNFAGLPINVSRPEDTILMKLRWAELSGGSEKQFVDALRVYEVQHHQLDQPYLALWAAKLNIQPLWDRLKREAQIV